MEERKENKKVRNILKRLFNLGLVSVAIVAVLIFVYLVVHHAWNINPLEGERWLGTKRSYTIPWEEVNKEINIAQLKAYTETEKYAVPMVDSYIAELKKRVDNLYIPYLKKWTTYYNLKLKSLIYWIAHKFGGEAPSEKIHKELQKQFEEMVLDPVLAQKRVEEIYQKVMNFYITSLLQEYEDVRKKFNIPQPVWREYTRNISSLVQMSIPQENGLGFRVIVIGTSAMTLPAVAPTIGKFVERAMIRVLGEETAYRIMSSLPLTTIGRGTLMTIGAGVAIIGLEMWDLHRWSENVDTVVREKLHTYLDEVGREILYNPETGILTNLNYTAYMMSTILRGNQTGAVY